MAFIKSKRFIQYENFTVLLQAFCAISSHSTGHCPIVWRSKHLTLERIPHNWLIQMQITAQPVLSFARNRLELFKLQFWLWAERRISRLSFRYSHEQWLQNTRWQTRITGGAHYSLNLSNQFPGKTMGFSTCWQIFAHENYAYNEILSVEKNAYNRGLHQLFEAFKIWATCMLKRPW